MSEQINGNALVDANGGSGLDLKAEIRSSGNGLSAMYSSFVFEPASGQRKSFDRNDGYRQHRIAQVHGRSIGNEHVVINLGSVVLLQATEPFETVEDGVKVRGRRPKKGGLLYPACTLASYGPDTHKRSYTQADSEEGKVAIEAFRTELAEAGLAWFQRTGQKLNQGENAAPSGVPSGVKGISAESVGA